MLRTAALAATILLAACRAGPAPEAKPAETSVAPVLATEDAVDIHSYARPLEARVTHVDLDLDVDFEARKVSGTATLDIQKKADATEIVLDSHQLEIESITDGKGNVLAFETGEMHPEMGAPLTVKLGKDTERLVIDYAAAKESSALQWLSPAQTAGKKHPYLFSQGQSILNRSWFPTQDSPGIRQTWEAEITVPAPLTAVMSAPRSKEPVEAGGKRTFFFEMDKSVPTYLIAIAVGDLEFRELGPRSGVWTEPSMIEAAARELEDTEKMIDAAEDLFGPYLWGRYDMLVLPPSFPFGGMENPTLTFLTPTFIAGDKSLVALIAHELAHSWSGNLATNATWADFWLNEGTTVYAEQRIIEAVYGKEMADQQIALSMDAVDEAIAEHGGADGPDTRLHIDLAGRHPDEGLTGIAYDKGAAFLRTIEKTVGRERFDEFMRGWFQRHAFEPVTSKMFLAELREYLVKGDEELEAKLKLDEWVYEPGLPDNVAPANPQAFAEVDAAVKAFASSGSVPAKAWTGWNTDERLRFLNKLPRKVSTERLAKLEQALRLNASANNEVLFAWLKLAVENRYDAAVPVLEEFVIKQGRRKFVRPLFTALAEDSQWGRPIAERLYPKARPIYHPLTQKGIDELGLPTG